VRDSFFHFFGEGGAGGAGVRVSVGDDGEEAGAVMDEDGQVLIVYHTWWR
jgi:hypothetical protein